MVSRQDPTVGGEQCARRDRCEMSHQKIDIIAQCDGLPGGKVQGAWRK